MALDWCDHYRNIDVLQRILGFKPVDPKWTIVPANKRPAGSVVFANSITLTWYGGVDIYEHEQAHYILVNAISPDGAADLDNGGEMGERCQRLEGE